MIGNTKPPRILSLEPKKLIGISIEMSVVEDRTGFLWGSFMPRVKEIENRVSNDLISLQVYVPGYFENFSPKRKFKKYAALEIALDSEIPEGLERVHFQGGLYAVFDYKGLSSDKSIFQYIYGVWLPKSGYHLDDRPHFEVLGEHYKNNDPNSEEAIWIPILPRES